MTTAVTASADGDQRIRHGLLLRATLSVLAEAGGPVPSGEVLTEVARRVGLNEHEASSSSSGVPRYETLIRYATSWMKAIGWMDKSRPAGWWITAAGHEAMARYTDDELYLVSRRQYQEQLQASKAADGIAADPRWQAVRDAVAAVPAGSWTTYGDVAAVSGLSAQNVGGFLGNTPVANAHRVLRAEGIIAPGFRWPDSERTDDPRQVLEAEGIEFDEGGHASAAQRVTAEDLAEIVGTPATGTRAWLVRGSAVSGINVVPQWISEEFVSLAAAHLRPVEPGISLEDLRSAVETDYAHLSYNQRTAKLAELHAFLNRMSPGDVVATTSEGRVFVGRITGEAVYAEPDDSRTTIRRSVTWDADGIDFTDLPSPLAARLKSSTTVLDLTEVAESVEALLPGRPATIVPPPAEQKVELPDLPEKVIADLLVGRDWLEEFVELLRTRHQVILYGPPGTGKTYLALKVAEALTDQANVTLVQFHPAYSYEDFFEGYRPVPADESGRVGFTLTPGPFRKIVDEARQNLATPYVLIIDEINRANLAKVFGELYFLLEYRDRSIELMYASGDEGREFTLPDNVFIVGTMNTADRSIAPLDTAMRRRFAFLSLHPDDPHLDGVLRAWLEREKLPTRAADLLDQLNRRVQDRDFKVGHSHLMRPEAGTDRGRERIWRTSILPLLQELHYDDPGFDVNRRYGLDELTHALGTDPAAASGGPDTASAEPEPEPEP